MPTHVQVSGPHQVSAGDHHGVPVVYLHGHLGAQAARELLATLGGTGSGDAIISLEHMTSWSREAVETLHGTTVRRLAFVAPPAELLASIPSLAATAMFPSIDTAVAVLADPPGPLAFLPAGTPAIHHAHRAFDRTPASVFTIRQWMRVALARWGLRSNIDAVVIALTDLTAIGGQQNTPVHVAAYIWRDTQGRRLLTVSVFDSDPHMRAPDPSPGGVSRSGSQLGLIAGLADHVGCYRQLTDPTGKIMWFAIGLAGDSRQT